MLDQEWDALLERVRRLPAGERAQACEVSLGGLAAQPLRVADVDRREAWNVRAQDLDDLGHAACAAAREVDHARRARLGQARESLGDIVGEDVVEHPLWLVDLDRQPP